MKTIHIATLITFACLLSACQGSPATALSTPSQRLLTQEVRATATFTNVPTRIPSTSTPTPQEIKVTSTIEQAIPVISMPILDMNASLETGKFVDSSHKFVGKLYVGSSYSGEYIQFDFDQNRISRIKLPKGCQLLATGKEAICYDSYHVHSDGYSLYNVSTNEIQRPFTFVKGKWILTSFGRLIESVDVLDGIETIESYDLVTKEVIQIGTFEDRDNRFLFPFLSNSGKQMVGVEYGNDPWLLDSRWYFMEKGSMMPESILIPDPLYATTDSVAWAPDDSRVVLLAAWDDVETHSGLPLCGKEILLFDPKTKSVESIGGVPPERCITEFLFYPHRVWSPDGSKIVLVLDQQDICIKDLSQKEASCRVITNNYGSDRYLNGVTWSVDSQWLAYMMRDTLLQVYSIQNNKTYIVADFTNVSADELIGLNMVWGK